jgi:hypothetical protein
MDAAPFFQPLHHRNQIGNRPDVVCHASRHSLGLILGFIWPGRIPPIQ